MSVILKPTKVKYRDPDSKQYIGINAISDDTAENVVGNWLNNHPEATTSVQDGSISHNKLSTSLLSDINAAKAAINGVLVAENTSQMTQENTAYVYTGTQSGYTAGKWYYKIGNTIKEGGTYQGTIPVVDETLTISGAAADAAKTGEEISDLKSAVDPFLSVGKNLLNLTTLSPNTYINKDTGNVDPYNGWTSSDFIPVDEYTQYRLIYLSNGSYVRATGQNLYFAFYNANKTYVRGGIGDGMYGYENSQYIRVSCPSSYFANNIMFLTDADASNRTTSADYEPYSKSTEPFIDKTNTAIEDIKSLKTIAIDSVIYSSNDVTFETGLIRYWSGEFDSSGMVSTNYLDIADYQGASIIVKARKPVGNYAGLAFYDDNRKFLQGVDYDDAGNTSEAKAHDIKVQVPKGAKYLRATTYESLTSDFAVLLDIEHSVEAINAYAPLMVSEDIHWVNFNPSGTKISLTDTWKTNALQAYENMQDYLRDSNSYNFASLLIETDSHGRGTLPFNWMQKIDNSVRCCHLGDIVDDYYNYRELNYYYQNTKVCKKLITIVGNHDAYIHTGKEQGNQYDLIRLLNSTDRMIAEPNGCFKVVDYDQRITYICLNPYKIITGGSTVAVTAEQMTWFIDELTNSEFDVVLLAHNAINDTNLVDRDGNSGSSYIGGPYPTGYDYIDTILKAFKNKTSGSFTSSTYGTVTYNFTNVTVDLICALSGHVHHELFKTDTYLTYAANWYGNTHCCVFFVVDKTNKKVAFFQFDNNTVYDTLEFNY